MRFYAPQRSSDTPANLLFPSRIRLDRKPYLFELCSRLSRPTLPVALRLLRPSDLVLVVRPLGETDICWGLDDEGEGYLGRVNKGTAKIYASGE